MKLNTKPLRFIKMQAGWWGWGSGRQTPAGHGYPHLVLYKTVTILIMNLFGSHLRTQKKKKIHFDPNMNRLFDLGVRKGGTILIWGYAEGYNFDLGVCEYLKVENSCVL
jgi:hypothetical protein